MKKKLLITSSLITILLALFPVSLYAEEVVQDPAPVSPSDPGVLLDSYFYQNYDILPYIESSGTQYINTGINASNNLRINIKYSNFILDGSVSYLFGSRVAYQQDMMSINIDDTNINRTNFRFGSYDSYFNIDYIDYVIYYFKFDKNLVYLNGDLMKTFTDSQFTGIPIYIFALNNNGTILNHAKYRLYSFSIYDYSLDLNNEEIGYVRYYYPAKAKSSGTIGLYDAVSKTFFPSLGSGQFVSPTDDKVLNFQIGDFISSGLDWFEDIFEFVIAEPMILFFMAVGLAGALYRWARRLVHF